VLNREDETSIGMALAGREVYTFGLDEPKSDNEWGLRQVAGEAWLAHGTENLMKAGELPLAGLHNAANALAALALCAPLDLPIEALLLNSPLAALREFKGLPHRVEYVAEIGGATYYDDSKGTNVGATVAALSGFSSKPGKVVLIAGGDGKGQDFGPLRAAAVSHARAVVLIGRDGPKIDAVLAGCGVPLASAATLEEAVALAAGLAQRGDAVLLSPACASWDMFRNYAHRAEVFIDAVQRLARGERP